MQVNEHCHNYANHSIKFLHKYLRSNMAGIIFSTVKRDEYVRYRLLLSSRVKPIECDRSDSNSVFIPT